MMEPTSHPGDVPRSAKPAWPGRLAGVGGLVDWADVASATMPGFMSAPFQAAFDYTANDGFRSVLSGEKSLPSAGVELLFNSGSVLLGGAYSKHAPNSGVPGLIGDQTMKFGAGAAAKDGSSEVKDKFKVE